MSFITEIFKGGTSGVFTGLGDLVGKFVADPTQKKELEEKIQELVISQQTQLAQLAEEKYEAQLKDIDSARQMQISALKQESWFAKNYIHILSSIITIGFFGLLWYMVKFDVPAANKDMLNIMLGSLGTAWITCVAFYFGSSSSSKTKDDTIKQLSQS